MLKLSVSTSEALEVLKMRVTKLACRRKAPTSRSVPKEAAKVVVALETAREYDGRGCRDGAGQAVASVASFLFLHSSRSYRDTCQRTKLRTIVGSVERRRMHSIICMEKVIARR